MPRASPARSATTCPRRPAPDAGGEAAVRDQDDDRAADPVRARGRSARRRRLPGLRDLELGAGPATRAATTSSTGSGVRTRRSGPGAHAFDGVSVAWNAARLDGYLRGAVARGRRRRRRCRPAARTRSMAMAPPPRPSSWRCGWTPGWRWPRPAADRSPRTSTGRCDVGLLEPFDDGDGPRVRLTTRGRPAVERAVRTAGLTRTTCDEGPSGDGAAARQCGHGADRPAPDPEEAAWG